MVKNAITVFARVKPEKGRKGIVNYKIHRRPKKHSNEDFLVLTAPQRLSEYIDNRPESWNFSFHRIFGHEVPQDDIFESVARPIVNSIFDGYNATIFAYGQTGSGKTYTITGEPGVHVERGILPRTLQCIFDTVRKNPENLYSVEVAYLEIYNENGYDLLLERKQRDAATRLEDLPRVTIQEDDNGAMHLKNLSFRIVENEREALKFLMDGDNYRAISETPMNPRSSRSHCIFTIVVSVKKFGADRYSSAKMHLVDLAGSERVYKCAIQGTILTEAKHINLSLHFLEQVIVCLSQENVSHVPYRNSLLTSILRDSLGGNCLTTMLANLSVSNFNLEETISTCRFAQRVALVRNDVNLSFELDTRSENKLLRMENDILRKQIEVLKKSNNPAFICTDLSTGSLGYYKNSVIQRDQEISRLIDILKKERARRESVVKKATPRSIEISRDEKTTQMPSSRVSPRKNDLPSPTRLQTRKKSLNSLRVKSQTSPRKNEVISPQTTEKIKSRIESSKSEIPSVPALTLDIDDFEIEKKTLRIDSVRPVVFQNKIEASDMVELQKSPIEQNETTGKKVATQNFAKNYTDTLENSSRKDMSSEKNCPREETPDEMTRNSCNRRSSDERENSKSGGKSEAPRSDFKEPNILRNNSRVEKNTSVESAFVMDEILRGTRKKYNDDDKIDDNFRKLPLTGDPEIDEEIIAFYRAKRGGGSY